MSNDDWLELSSTATVALWSFDAQLFTAMHSLSHSTRQPQLDHKYRYLSLRRAIHLDSKEISTFLLLPIVPHNIGQNVYLTQTNITDSCPPNRTPYSYLFLPTLPGPSRLKAYKPLLLPMHHNNRVRSRRLAPGAATTWPPTPADPMHHED
jgi:hypothetical protein